MQLEIIDDKFSTIIEDNILEPRNGSNIIRNLRNHVYMEISNKANSVAEFTEYFQMKVADFNY